MEIKVDKREAAESLEMFINMWSMQNKGFLFLRVQMALPKEDWRALGTKKGNYIYLENSFQFITRCMTKAINPFKQ